MEDRHDELGTFWIQNGSIYMVPVDGGKTIHDTGELGHYLSLPPLLEAPVSTIPSKPENSAVLRIHSHANMEELVNVVTNRQKNQEMGQM